MSDVTIAPPERAVESCRTCICAMWINSARDANGAEVLQGYCRFNPPAVLAVARGGPIGASGPKIIGQPSPPGGIELVPSYALTNSEQWCAHHMTAEEYPHWKAARLGDLALDDGGAEVEA